MNTAFRRLPPHMVRALLSQRDHPFLYRMRNASSSASGTPLHPRLRRKQHEIGRALGVDDPSELAAALEEIATLFARCVLHMKSQLATRRQVRSWQTRKLRERRGPVPRGRPPGAADFAARQFGLGLATLWWEQTGRRPTRTYASVLGVEKGAYRAFVQLIVDTLPRSVLRKQNGRWLDIDYIVRQSAADFNQARLSEDEYRRRGLIDEKPWLGAVIRSAPAEAPPSN